MPAVPKGSKVLVTSGSGFIGAWTCLLALRDGLAVRTSVRSNEKGDYLKELFASYGDKFEYCIVEDLEKEGAFDEAVQGVQGIAHTGSPFHFDIQGDPYGKLINPAVNGTTNVLKSALAHGKDVKRIVVTSSFASVLDGSPELKDRMVLNVDEDWNNWSPAQVEKHGKDVPGSEAYRASKVLAERAAWAFVKEKSPNWDLVTVCPPLVLGPIIHQVASPEKLNTSSGFAYALFAGKKNEEDLPNPVGNCVDVRDVADVHVKSLLVEAAGGQRLPASFGPFTWQDFADAAHASSSVPQSVKDKTPVGKPGSGKEAKQKKFDGSKAEKVLGIKYKGFEEQTKDMVISFEDYAQRGWKGIPSEKVLSL